MDIIYNTALMSSSYITSDVYCKCDENKFIKITNLQTWEGCKNVKEFMNEENFVNELKQQSKYAKKISGNMGVQYIKIVEDKIKMKKLYYLIAFIVFIFVFYLLYKKRKLSKKK